MVDTGLETEVRALALALAGVRRGDRVLDLVPEHGLSRAAAAAASREGLVVACGTLPASRREPADADAPVVRVQVYSRLPFGADTFSRVLVCTPTLTWAEAAPLVAEAVRTCRPGARLLLAVQALPGQGPLPLDSLGLQRAHETVVDTPHGQAVFAVGLPIVVRTNA